MTQLKRLFIDTHEEKVFFARGLSIPQIFSGDFQQLVDFVRSSELPVYLLGTQANARLLVALAQQKDPHVPIYLASPKTCRKPGAVGTARVVYLMRQINLAASLGGWHSLTAVDLLAYRIADATRTGDIATAVELLHQHPVFPMLSFIPTLQPVAVAKLIGTLLDPRWYVGVQHPERLSALRIFLGVVPNVFHRAIRTETPTAAAQQRCRLTVQAWGGLFPAPSPADSERPANFLWRRARCHGQLRATQTFVTYLVKAWQHVLQQANGRQAIELFQPESILQPLELAAYKTHMAKAEQPKM